MALVGGVPFFLVLCELGLLMAMALKVSNAQSLQPAMSPNPTSDGVAIDQGIAYVLMLAALVLTYIIH